MAKQDKSVWMIFFEGLKIYSFNLHKFFLYMLFPVFGQLLGLFMVFGMTFWFSQNITELTNKYPALSEISTMVTCIVLLTVPGLLLWAKAFWDFLVAYGAVNSMTEGYLTTGKVYDFRAHNQTVTNKTFSFIALWFIFGTFSLLAIIPIFWILGFIFFVYFVLIFQVFTFENGLSPIGYFKRSFSLVKGKFARTFLLMTILFLLTYYLLPAGLSVIFDYLNITQPLAKGFEAWAFTLPIEPIEKFGITPATIGTELTKQLVFCIIVGLTLPLRSICWTLWYNNLNKEPLQVEKPKKSTKKTVKNTKLPKNFKIEKRGIDPEIIRRARLEDDEY